MKRKNIVAMVTSVALVGVVAVGGTLALLTSNTSTVTNTFAIGSDYPDLALTLDEYKVKRDTSAGNFGGWVADTGADRVAENNYNDLIPGTILDKDPTFHLAAGSPESWIVAYVTGIDALDNKVDVTTLPENYGWYKLDEDTTQPTEITQASDLTDGYYVVKAPIAAGGNTTALFTKMTVQDAAVGQSLGSIVVKGVAVDSVTGDWDTDGAAVLAQISDMLEK